MTIIQRCWPLAVIAALAFCVAISAGGGEKSQPFKPTASEQEIFELTNIERKKEKSPPLKLSLALCKIARAHSENMARKQKMAHNLDDKTPFDRLKRAGYFYSFAGENVGEGTANVGLSMLMEAWMKSPGHRKNILDPNFSQIGIGIASDSKGNRYFTQLFGTPKK